MVYRSNAVAFEVLEVPPQPEAGWEVRVLDFRDYTTQLAVISEWMTLMVGPELSGAGQGAITFDQDGAFWTSLLPNGRPAWTLKDGEYLFQAYEDGAFRFEWLGRNVTEAVLDDSESHTITIAGPGTGDVLKWAKILPPGFPKLPPVKKVNTELGTSVTVPDDTSADNGHPANLWEFPPNTPAMNMFFTLLTAAQSRGTLRFVTPTFTAGADSGKVKWVDVRTVEDSQGHGFRPDMGTDLLTFLNTCTGQEPTEFFATHCEWMMRPGFKLEVRNVRGDVRGDVGIGTHRQGQVVFFEGNLLTLQRQRTRDDLGNYVVVRDAYGTTSLRVDKTSVASWNQREIYEGGTANVTEAARRNALADVYLAKVKDETSQWTIAVPYDLPGRRPFRDYKVGDWIGVSSLDDNGVSKLNAYRVMALTVQVANDQATVELTLQSMFDLRQRRLAEQITQIINRVNNSSSTVVVPGDNYVSYPEQIIRNPDGSIKDGPYVTPDIPGYSNVFIQDTDPGDKAQVGAFWYDTSYVPPPDVLEDPVIDEELDVDNGIEDEDAQNRYFFLHPDPQRVPSAAETAKNQYDFLHPDGADSQYHFLHPNG